MSKGRLPITSTKLPGTWADVAAGVYDSWLTTLINGLIALDGPVFLCFHHEPYDDMGPGQQPADYVAMYARAKTFTAGSNVSLCPILQSAHFDPSVGGHQDITPWFGSECDIIGLDSYNHWYYYNGTTGNKWREPSVCFGAVLDAVQQLNKPVCYAEYGVRTDSRTPPTYDSAAWMQTAHDYLINNGVVAMSYFDSDQNVNDGGTPWTLDWNGDNTRLDAFKNILNGPNNYFLP